MNPEKPLPKSLGIVMFTTLLAMLCLNAASSLYIVSRLGADRAWAIDLNRADASDLVELPEIDKVLAARIVNERRADGDYWSAADVAARVEGVGEKRAAVIESACVFRVRKP